MPVSALLVVDVQRDFCPGGSLAVKGGDGVTIPLNRIISAYQVAGMPIFFSRDWHPRNHCSFKERGGQWPVHCVMGTQGAEFHPNLRVPEDAAVISKATSPDLEAYSAFQGTRLESALRRLAIKELVVGGLATDYCVKQTCLDALRAGFAVYVLTDCIAGVELEEGDSRRALETMKRAGAKLTTSKRAVELCRRAAMMSSSRP